MKYSFDRVNAVVLAGGINRIPLFRGSKPGYKALLPLAGIPLVRYILDCLRSVLLIHRICIVGPCDLIRGVLSDPEKYEYVPEGETLLQNISAGLEHFRQSDIVLLTTADLPLLTPGALNDFIKACRDMETPYESNIFWSMVPERSFKGAFQRPGKSFNRFRDIAVCHGNLLFITPKITENRKVVRGIERIYKKRKSSVLSALALDPLVGFTYLFGVHLLRLLTLKQMSVFLSGYFNAGLIPVIHDHPESATDIDESGDYEFICEQLNREPHNDC